MSRVVVLPGDKPLTEFYTQILLLHVAAVAASGTLFAVRGATAMAGMYWATSAPVRYASYTIDTVLLAAALMLVAVLPGEAFSNHWLTVKLTLLVAYIVLGVFAMRRGRTLRTRLVCYVTALFVFTSIVGIARAHSPLGWFAWYGLS